MKNFTSPILVLKNIEGEEFALCVFDIVQIKQLNETTVRILFLCGNACCKEEVEGTVEKFISDWFE